MGFANLEAYAGLESPLHRWTPRLKLISLGSLMFAFAAVQVLWLLPLMLLTVAVFYGLSRLPLGFLLERLRYPGMFIAAVVLV
ncbi:cobalt ECF transporter T component CbiQ, partial [filamentous cyanobacterium CCP5]